MPLIAANPPPITAVGLVTCDRTTSLVACLDSYLENCRHHQRDPEFIITDDSATEAVQDQTRAALQACRTQHGAQIRYGSRRERTRFVEALAREAAAPLEIVRFGILGDDRCTRSTGANRNSLLLDSVDALALSVDDDTRCRTAAPPDPRDGLAFFSGYDPTEFWFIDEERSAIDSASHLDADVLSCHEALLGRATADLNGAAAPGRVVTTVHGLAGDSGMASPRYYLGLDGASRERLVASPTVYRSAFRSREILRAVRRLTCSTGTFFMSTFFGYDNRELLPPFFPVLRNADGIFGLILQRSVDGSHIGYLPSVLVHRPVPSRIFAPEAMWAETRSLRMADVIIACVLAHNEGTTPRSDATRLVELGRSLQAFGSLTRADFEARVRGLHQLRMMAFITVLQTRLQTHAASPTFWADDVKRMIEALSKQTWTDDAIVPTDLRLGNDVDSARRLSQELVARFGELLEAWPAIVAAARRLRAGGCRLTTAI